MSDDLVTRLRAMTVPDLMIPALAFVPHRAADCIEALDAKLDEAVEALKPFGECADFYEPDWLDEQETEERLTIGELRRARAALAKLTGE